VVYLERTPRAPLNRFVSLLWSARAPCGVYGHERVLPNGCIQLIISLARDFLLDCPESQPEVRRPPALIVGARSVYEMVAQSDMADLIGVVFQPGSFPAFAGEAAHLFSNRNIPLTDLWERETRSLRERLLALDSAEARFACLERFLLERTQANAANPSSPRSAAIRFALTRIAQAPGTVTVREVARSIGWSERRFSQVFREDVGLTPKLWCRIRRFQRAVRMLHAGADVPWAELALDCGFYDQSHFANEFRAFSGVDATAYSSRRTRWANHIHAD